MEAGRFVPEAAAQASREYRRKAAAALPDRALIAANPWASSRRDKSAALPGATASGAT